MYHLLLVRKPLLELHGAMRLSRYVPEVMVLNVNSTSSPEQFMLVWGLMGAIRVDY